MELGHLLTRADGHLPLFSLSYLSNVENVFLSGLSQWGKCCWYIQHALYSVPYTWLNIRCMLAISA
jgi:hypothetical protein